MSLTLPSGVTALSSSFQSASLLPEFPKAAMGTDLLGGPQSSGNTLAPVTQSFSSGVASLGAEPTDVSALEVTARKGKGDMRVRLSALPTQQDDVYGEKVDDGSNILSILHDTNGIVFPYTPSISVEQSVDYKNIDLTHANGDINAYTRTPSVTINITGKFTVQNQREGEYLIAVLHFLRVASKMHFGEKSNRKIPELSVGCAMTKPVNGGEKAGLPPPILQLNGYGTYMFNGLKSVIKTHSYSLDETVDYVDVKIDNTYTRVPSLLTVSVSLGIQQTPTMMRKEFNLSEFRTGALMRGSNSGRGWI